MNVVSRDRMVHVLGRIASYVEAYAASTNIDERKSLLDVIDVALTNVRNELAIERSVTERSVTNHAKDHQA